MRVQKEPCCYLCADVGEFGRTDRGIPVCPLCAEQFLEPTYAEEVPDARPTPEVFSTHRGVFEVPDDAGFP